MEILNRHQLERPWPEHACYVGRGTALGNPIAISEEISRNQAIDQYRDYLRRAIKDRDPVIMTSLRGLSEKSGLVCSCHPRPCHAQVIRELWYEHQQDIKGDNENRPITYRYAGIGSRKLPKYLFSKVQGAARRLGEIGFVVLSGGASGTDKAFEAGVSPEGREIFLPWPNFNHHQADSKHSRPSSVAYRIAAEVHPYWKILNLTAQSLLARNSHQILGEDLRSPVDFVLCYTPDGATSEKSEPAKLGVQGKL